MSRILIADDDALSRGMLAVALAGPTRELVLACDGGELLEQLAEHGPFDAIVTDLDMPWIQGQQVLATVRAAGLDTPALVITGWDRPDLGELAAALGTTRVLRKPVAIADVRRVVGEMLAATALRPYALAR